MAQESPSHRPQLAWFDHVYAVVDAQTADEIARSDYLHGFGRFVVGTTVADGEKWTGRYLFGRRTYLEMFGPVDLQGPDGAEGSTGIGLSIHQRGALAMLAARIGDDDGRVQRGQTTRQEGDQDIAWFDHLSPLGTTQALEVWVMEFPRRSQRPGAPQFGLCEVGRGASGRRTGRSRAFSRRRLLGRVGRHRQRHRHG